MSQNPVNPKVLLIVILATLLFPSYKGWGQEVDNQLWINYAISIPVNEKFTYGGDIGLRGLISNYDWNQILIRPNISYRFNHVFSVSPAIAWFSTINNSIGNVNEFRLHQDFNVKWPDLGFVEFFYRVRVEERFFFFQDGQLDNRFNLRVRGLIGLETDDIKVFNGKRPIYFQVIYEGFTSFDEYHEELFVNQTRFHIALGHRISNSFRYELHYIRQGARLYSTDGIEIAQNIYRIRLFHRLVTTK